MATKAPNEVDTTDPTSRFGGSQSVLIFDGQEDYVDLGEAPEHKITKDLTIEAWVNVFEQGAWAGVVSKIHRSGSEESGYGLLLDGKSGVYFGLKVPSAAIAFLSSGPDSVPLDEWHHVAATYDGAQMILYVDGE